MKKLFFTCIFLLGIILTGFSQSDKVKEKANKWVNDLNTEIVSVDKFLALTEVQQKQITTIQIERIKELKKAKKEGADKEGADKEANKAINKKHFQKIFKKTLTKEQMKARKNAKEKSKQ